MALYHLLINAGNADCLRNRRDVTDAIVSVSGAIAVRAGDNGAAALSDDSDILKAAWHGHQHARDEINGAHRLLQGACRLRTAVQRLRDGLPIVASLNCVIILRTLLRERGIAANRRCYVLINRPAWGLADLGYIASTVFNLTDIPGT
ncbi:hypothetical protein S2091_1535 [Solimicrobium silvestre]|uniref:Uncharacterized protein n=1 Tax=Solimicrobium silvestre TaxID=2099400 RepID=A0A2S9H231_9BURK|nr:hypothetical protein S2091_1535 [Solimicrobium silvestre]